MQRAIIYCVAPAITVGLAAIGPCRVFTPSAKLDCVFFFWPNYLYG